MMLEHEFYGIRVVNNKLIPTKWKLDLKLAGKVSSSDDLVEAKKKIAVSFYRLNYWLELFLVDPVFLDVYDEASVEFLGDSDMENTVIYCPGTPTDDLLAELLHSKLYAIAKGEIALGQIQLRSEDARATITFSPVEIKAYSLPTQEEFMGEDAVFPEPWWSRYDCDTHDYVIDDDGVDPKDRATLAEELSSRRILDDFTEEQYAEQGIEKTEDPQGEIISPWKPKLV
jgi:hypothetical protein